LANTYSGDTRFFFANPNFSESNALFAPQTFLWKGNDDDVKSQREEDCKISKDRLGKFYLPYCDITSVGHPNHQGAERYANVIIGLIAQIYILDQKPVKGPCEEFDRNIAALRRELTNIQKQMQSAPTSEKSELLAQARSLQKEINHQLSLKNECLKNPGGIQLNLLPN
jgi:hypothetical protein